MYMMMNAHPVTVIMVAGAFMVTPVYVLATYVFSGASRTKGLLAGSGFLGFGSLMFWVCLRDLPRGLGLAGNLLVPVAWILPGLLLCLKREWFLSRPLSQQWLIGLQLFRVIGGVFLIEMSRGNLPAIFAYPAGLGDILVALVALAVLLRYMKDAVVPKPAIFLVIGLGLADFLSAFFFASTSAETPLQLFFSPAASAVVVFPTGVIPLFLVSYAIFFHILSGLNYMRWQRGRTSAKGMV